MLETKIINPDYIFEVSWEVCNKVGGIYTVLTTKALTLVKEHRDNLIFIGPDVWKETRDNPDFTEDKFLFRSWKEHAEKEGLHFKLGRWNIAGNPVVILADFTKLFSIKDKIFADLWIKFKLDSLSGQWDYTEPAMFGYAAAKIIESFYKYNLSSRDKIIAQFHEWLTGTGVLYLKDAVPQVGTVFTTHATTVGRSIAGNGLPLYRDLLTFDGDLKAKEFGISSKQSLEKNAALNADCFTTVSEITAKECAQFLGKDTDIITPNGFEDSFVPDDSKFDEKRHIARTKLFDVAEALLNQKLDRGSLLVINSGRYEYKNKGIDLFIDSMAKINDEPNNGKCIIAFITVPANYIGPRTELLERIENPDFNNPISQEYLTHNLHDSEYDPILKRIREKKLNNSPTDKVKIIFVPCYFNSFDGIFNLPYYDLLIGFDLSAFPSYYEPWGYTPLESIAFHIPTITTSLAGFGLWMKSRNGSFKNGVMVIERDDDNNEEVVNKIVENIILMASYTEEEVKTVRQNAYNVSRNALWLNLIKYYKLAYSIALEKVELRSDLFKDKEHSESPAIPEKYHQKPNWKKVLVKSELPKSLTGLNLIARNLWWTWHYEATELFEMVDPDLWEENHHNPLSMIESLTYEHCVELAKEEDFMIKLNMVFADFNHYMEQKKDKTDELIAYFSMEFGLHDSVKIFSGGLGILAGDCLKEASDSNVNIVGVGLLYRYGYFNQNLSLSGAQLATYLPQKFTRIPVEPVRDKDGNWVMVSLSLPGRVLYAKVWKIEVGRVTLYLMDTDIELNSEADRFITHLLYGGDNENRLKQELLLGVGGIRLFEKLEIHPKIYHCNEGHAAFIGLERLRKYVQDENLAFSEAIEVVRSSTLFTTHTPVPAGHDSFSDDLLRTYIPHYPDRLNISWDTFIGYGKVNENDPTEKFSMSILAAKLSQEMNGVSKIHGIVSQKMFNDIWEGYFPEELHVGYVTNGVHYQTWAAKSWQQLYQKEFGEGFLNNQSDRNYWKKIHNVPDVDIWNIRQNQRKELFEYLKSRILDNLTIRQENPKTIFDTLESFNDKALTIGFARRFATYKRAHLLFKNLEHLSEIVNNKHRPVQFLFAGKAHPNDKAGQDLIKMVIEISRKKEFIGKITFLENYDIELAKKLVQGVDIWLNTPTRPLEASGTSGEKAVMNGVVNFSVLDGWWAEGYVPYAGWSLPEKQTYENTAFQDELDAETIYNILEGQIIPTFYDRNEQDVPVKWISYVKNTISDIAPRFTTKRMIDDYQEKFYKKLLERSHHIHKNNYEMAKQIASWKKKVMRSWESIEVVSINIPDSTNTPLVLGENFQAEIVLDLNELADSDVGIEVVFGQKKMDEVQEISFIREMNLVKRENHQVTFTIEIPAIRAGVFDYAFRVYPKNNLLAHRQDFGIVKWL